MPKSTELSGFGIFANVRSETGPSKVQRIDEAERGSTGSSTRGNVSSKELPEILLGVNRFWQEDRLEGILERKVESLGREVTDDVGHVTTP